MSEEGRTPHQTCGNAFGQGLSIEAGDIQAMIGTKENIEQAQYRAFVTGFVEADAQLAPAEYA
ncbi:hypothetical protein D3C76_1460540 [compost metagenome]